VPLNARIVLGAAFRHRERNGDRKVMTTLVVIRQSRDCIGLWSATKMQIAPPRQDTGLFSGDERGGSGRRFRGSHRGLTPASFGI